MANQLLTQSTLSIRSEWGTGSSSTRLVFFRKRLPGLWHTDTIPRPHITYKSIEAKPFTRFGSHLSFSSTDRRAWTPDWVTPFSHIHMGKQGVSPYEMTEKGMVGQKSWPLKKKCPNFRRLEVRIFESSRLAMLDSGRPGRWIG